MQPQQILGHHPVLAYNLLILADGFASTDMHLFASRCDSIAHEIEHSWWYQTAGNLTIWRMDTAVEATGNRVTMPPTCPWVLPFSLPVTRYAATFGKGGVCRGLGGDDLAVMEMALHASQLIDPNFPAFNKTLVLVNTNIYGASSLGDIAWSCVKPYFFPGMAVHELGHTFGLNDEYENECGQPDPASAVPWTKDVNIGSDPTDLPWKSVMDVPVPEVVYKQDDSSCDKYMVDSRPDVGAYEGGNTRHKGYFRPCLECKMRHSRKPFCSVCQRVIANALDSNLVASPIT